MIHSINLKVAELSVNLIPRIQTPRKMPEPVPPELQAAGSPDRVRLTAQMPATETGTLTDMDLSDRLEIIADAKRSLVYDESKDFLRKSSKK